MPAYLGLAHLYVNMDDSAHAVATLRKALEAEPQNAAVWFELGMCHSRAKDWGPALEALGRAVTLEPENRQYVNTLGYALARAGMLQDAVTCLARVNGEAAARYQVARMLQHLQQPALSRQYLIEALQKNPDLTQARELLAQLDGVPAPTPPLPQTPQPAPPPVPAPAPAVQQAVVRPAPAAAAPAVQPVVFTEEARPIRDGEEVVAERAEKRPRAGVLLPPPPMLSMPAVDGSPGR
jgi:hypothetical protein